MTSVFGYNVFWLSGGWFGFLWWALIEVMPKIVFLGFTAGSLYNGHVLYYPSLKFSQYMPACYGKPKKKTVRLKTGG